MIRLIGVPGTAPAKAGSPDVHVLHIRGALMALVEAGEVSLNAVELGNGPPVVMIHGLLLGSSASWYFTAAPELAKRFRVLLYDMRGHGRSPRSACGYDTRTLAADLDGLLDSMGIDGPISLVGHSYGALVAMHYALAHPERVDRLALVEAPLPPSREPEIREFLQRAPVEMAAALPPVLQAQMSQGGRRAQRLVASLSYLALQTTLVRDLLAEPDVPDEQLARLNAPLLVYGQDSQCRDVGERIAAAVPGAQLSVLPGGHHLHLDAPEALTAELTAYLGRREELPIAA